MKKVLMLLTCILFIFGANAWAVTVSVPEMDVTYAGQPINDGSETPSTMNGTDFGEVLVAGNVVVKTYTITNSGSADLTLDGSPKVVVGGTHAADFTVNPQPTSPVAASGGTTTFLVTFDPSATGLRSATLSIDNNDSDEDPYNFSIQGTGIDPGIEVRGNDTWIESGDETPSPADSTDFGVLYIYTDTGVQTTFDIHNTGTTDLVIYDINVDDDEEDIFWMASSYATTVAPGGNTSVTIEFYPDFEPYYPEDLGTYEAYVDIYTNTNAGDEGDYWFMIEGDLGAPVMEVSYIDTEMGVQYLDTDSFIYFGEMEINTGINPIEFTIHNTGDADLELYDVEDDWVYVNLDIIESPDGPGFAVTEQPDPVIAPDDSTTFTVEFNPNDEGDYFAAVWIVNNDPELLMEEGGEFFFFNFGAGITAPEIELWGNDVEIVNEAYPPSLENHTDFGDVRVPGGEPVTRTFTIENPGSADLLLDGEVTVQIEQEGFYFEVVEQPSTTVSALGSTTFDVTFTPDVTGLISATISIENDDDDEDPYTFAIQGTGTAPEMDVFVGETSVGNEDTHDFGNANINEVEVTVTFTIENNGNLTLLLTGEGDKVVLEGTDAGEFSVDSQPGASIAPEGIDTFDVTFAPTSLGSKTATLIIDNDDNDESHYEITITGTGTTPEMAVWWEEAEIESGDLDAGDEEDGTDFGGVNVYTGTSTRTFTIYNNGTGLLELDNDPTVTIIGDADFWIETEDQPAETILGIEGGFTTFVVTFDPDDEGEKNATIIIYNNDPGEGKDPYAFAIMGTGTNPGIVVKYNAVSIPNPDEVPTPEKGTDFGNVLVGGEPMVRTFTIENTGDVDDLILTGDDNVYLASGLEYFTVTDQPESPIPAGESDTFTITFAPEARGELSDVVIIDTNIVNGGSEYTFAIEGTGIAPVLEVYYLGNEETPFIPNQYYGPGRPNEYNGTWFGEQEIETGSETHTFAIYNAGEVELKLTGEPLVEIITDPEKMAVIIDPFEISEQPLDDTIGPDEETTFTVTFDPQYAEFYLNRIRIANDGLYEEPDGELLKIASAQKVATSIPIGLPYEYDIGGEGILAPEIEVRGGSAVIEMWDESPSTGDKTDFGSVVVGQSVTNTFTIANIGSDDLYLSGSEKIALKTAVAEPDDMMVIVTIWNYDDEGYSEEFIVTEQPYDLIGAYEDYSTFDVTFTPPGLGLYQGEVEFWCNDSDEENFSFLIQGTGSSVPSGSITVLSPNGGETWASGSSQFIVWDSGQGVGMIEASVDGGTTWSLVADDVNLANGSYQVTVAELSSPDCLVRITTTDGTELSDTSD
ncbi:choice-of-anchor D domain-containing protein, partial [Candidatus Latescibacterota bacterium]